MDFSEPRYVEREGRHPKIRLSGSGLLQAVINPASQPGDRGTIFLHGVELERGVLNAGCFTNIRRVVGGVRNFFMRHLGRATR